MDTNTLLIVLGVLLVLFLLLVGVVAVIYNRFVKLRERIRNAYSQIDVQLKRRYDLIPNLVEAVKGYMQHERETLEAVVQARTQSMSANQQAAGNPTDRSAVMAVAGAENMLLGALGRLFALREAYPDLKADQSASRLMEELASTENRVAFARQHYNDSVTTYNTYRRSFPQVILAGSLGFEEAGLFEIDDAREREVVQVSLGSGSAGSKPPRSSAF